MAKKKQVSDIPLEDIGDDGEVVTEKTEKKPEPKKHTQRLVDLALSMGFTQADLDHYDSATIWEEIHRIQDLQSRSKPKPEPEPKKTEETDEDEAYLASLEAIPDMDKEHIKFLRRLKAKADAKDIREKLSKLDQLEEKEKNREIRNANDSVDAAFGALGKKYEKLVGKDAMAELTDPGEKGWRLEIFKQAKVDFAKDSQATINRKIKKAAEELANGKVEKEDEEQTADAYQTSRFTAEDFAEANLLKTGKKTGKESLNAVEAVRQMFRQNGDPRGFRPVIDMDDLPE